MYWALQVDATMGGHGQRSLCFFYIRTEGTKASAQPRLPPGQRAIRGSTHGPDFAMIMYYCTYKVLVTKRASSLFRRPIGRAGPPSAEQKELYAGRCMGNGRMLLSLSVSRPVGPQFLISLKRPERVRCNGCISAQHSTAKKSLRSFRPSTTKRQFRPPISSIL